MLDMIGQFVDSETNPESPLAGRARTETREAGTHYSSLADSRELHTNRFPT